MKRVPASSFRLSSRFLSTAFCCAVLLLLMACASTNNAQRTNRTDREYIELRVYHAADVAQLNAINQYLERVFIPALEQKGFERLGVFAAIDNDTATDKRMVVLVPFASLVQLQQIFDLTTKASGDSAAPHAAYNHPPYTRFETILLQAFAGMPAVKASGVQSDKANRVYELRSYESATEALHQNKVRMFNSGETDLFQRLGFNAVFYGQVLAGSHMPNLMYMTSFASKTARDEHWRAFGSDPQWKQLSSDPQFQNNVSHIDITFLRPTAYSRL